MQEFAFPPGRLGRFGGWKAFFCGIMHADQLREAGGWQTWILQGNLSSEGVAGGNAECIGDEVDVGKDVEFGFPVEGEIERRIRKFVVEPDGAGRTKVSFVILEADVAAKTPEPGKSRSTAD